MFYLLASKKFKQKRNQILHLMENGRTWCGTENVKRRKKLTFIEFEKSDSRPVCKVCLKNREEDKSGTWIPRDRRDPLTKEFQAVIGPECV